MLPLLLLFIVWKGGMQVSTSGQHFMQVLLPLVWVLAASKSHQHREIQSTETAGHH